LTAIHQRIDENFRLWFLDWIDRHDAYIVTGSDYPKTLEQVGIEILNTAELVFSCCGNQVRRKGDVVHSSDWLPPEALLRALECELDGSAFATKTGNHIELRTGMVNFSVLGRNASREERRRYTRWDEATGERLEIARSLTERFEEFEFSLGGETGLDIFPKGRDKRQVMAWIQGPLIFFGDRTEPGGNDHVLACVADVVHTVTGWEQTWEILKCIP
jgi:phosphomannomutase